MGNVPAHLKIRAKIKARNKQKRFEKLGRVAWCANYLRELDRPRTADDVRHMAEELGVTERTIYLYMKNDFPKLQVCQTCGRPFAEDKMIAALEAVKAI